MRGCDQPRPGRHQPGHRDQPRAGAQLQVCSRTKYFLCANKYFLCANKYFYRVMLDIKEKEIARLREAVEAGDKQLKIQTKVNEEVKRLLVAR